MPKGYTIWGAKTLKADWSINPVKDIYSLNTLHNFELVEVDDDFHEKWYKIRVLYHSATWDWIHEQPDHLWIELTDGSMECWIHEDLYVILTLKWT